MRRERRKERIPRKSLVCSNPEVDVEVKEGFRQKWREAGRGGPYRQVVHGPHRRVSMETEGSRKRSSEGSRPRGVLHNDQTSRGSLVSRGVLFPHDRNSDYRRSSIRGSLSLRDLLLRVPLPSVLVEVSRSPIIDLPRPRGHEGLWESTSTTRGPMSGPDTLGSE